MAIADEFNLVAKEYDAGRRKFIPCFDDFYGTATRLIVSNIKTPARVLDLGAGTGLLTFFWYKQCPSAEYVLADIAGEMLEVSKKRFAGIGNIKHIITDYTKELPAGSFDAVISALSIHHLEDKEKERLFSRIYDKLPAGGVFANYDQFCAGTKEIDRWYSAFWENQLAGSLSERDVELWQRRRMLDKECSVEAQIAMLYRCGFSEVGCVYLYHKFAVIAAIK
ncbi:MAG: class I SAM-dependent methyltransferase [Clostridiales bacterium]|jgi:tRNA (cmo5U34)-methyltransferase|nr:class I SAM-dependent methyltransferase [Clostridiales bacterium]